MIAHLWIPAVLAELGCIRMFGAVMSGSSSNVHSVWPPMASGARYRPNHILPDDDNLTTNQVLRDRLAQLPA